jgi:hypothetical protein
MDVRHQPLPTTIEQRNETGDATMTTRTHRRFGFSRFAIAGAFLLAGLAGTAQAASAAGPPLVDDGGSGASDRPIYLEHFGLVPTNGGPGSFTMHPELDGPTLVGSGSEREIVANAVGQETASTLDESARAADLIVLTSGSDTASSDTLDETARSADLIVLSTDATSETAVDTTAARHGQPF